MGTAADAVPTHNDDDLDWGRGALPSDDEPGPDELSEDDDARAPGDEDAGEGDDLPTADGYFANCGPTTTQLPDDLDVLKVKGLTYHLRIRGLSEAGLKADLKARLETAIADPRVQIDQSLLEAAAGSGADEALWEPIDPARINRPVFKGPEKFTPNPSLKWTPSTHPFDYMNGLPYVRLLIGVCPIFFFIFERFTPNFFKNLTV